MTAKEAVDLFKKFVAEKFTAAKHEFTTKDGKKLFSEAELADGVNVLNAESKPLEDGEYILADESKIEVKAGAITKFTKKPYTPKEYPMKGEYSKSIMCEGELAEGTSVSMKDATGSLHDLPDGNYSIHDGRQISVAKGKISGVANAPASQNSNTQNYEAMEALVKKVTEDFAAYKTSNDAALKEANNKIVAFEKEVTTFKTQSGELATKVKEGFELIAQMPATEATGKVPTTFKKETGDHKRTRLEGIMSGITALKLEQKQA